ncbi:S53 family peptidase [Bifidobacterium psychraerophilum]|uniref:S53 family peptidase n=1 Tax=Bifidobacterium psychraerophilum TaxID=218140 RepID=UPI0023F3A664|nr:S53 family peptidase [Bifidobacterium psychraerophilum]MCI1661061.1 S53 family peptidase [Bifidobacterium psychraerophilum]MCI1804584.1 S53 family peptidase [Bifidobacterium psychraerophilum]MCI2177089.1 S53 family peptidase [Bifidobacterium psychraerophilum]
MRLKRSFAGGVACIAVLASLSAAQGSAFGGSTLNDPKGPVPYARQVSTSSTRRTLSGTAPEWSRQGTQVHDDRSITATLILREDTSSSQLTSLRAWLSSQGLTVDRIHQNISALGISGQRSAVAQAFDTTFVQRRHEGRQAVAPSRDLSVPADLSMVQSVAGLVDTDAALPATTASPAQRSTQGNAASTQVSDDCAAYWGEKLSSQWPTSVNVTYRSNALCGYGPEQLRAIHELPASATGKGSRIAIVAAYDDATVEANTNTYFAKVGAQTFRSGQYTHHAPDSPDESRCGGSAAWTTEQHLDVQAAHAIAPDADIEYWGANDCSTNSLYLRILDAVESPSTPDVISLSFGAQEELDTDGDRALLNRVLVEAGSRDISVFASTGNDGDYTNAGDHQGEADVASPASSPYVTAVGGTSTGLNADNTIEVESGWETQTRFARNGAIIPPGFIYGAGGGESKYYTRPTWQKSLSKSGNGRLLPDVSSLADPNTGFTVYSPSDGTVEYEAHGGTSLATPMVAATVAVAKASSGVKVGLATPYLYSMAGSQAIRDVRPASAATWYRRGADTGQLWLETLYMWDVKPQSLQSSEGWDPVTGLGVPSGAAFLKQFGAQR